jgi:hypothetical protein
MHQIEVYLYIALMGCLIAAIAAFFYVTVIVGLAATGCRVP